ncbi:ABC transporter ATP-binding protein [Aurantivibrio infirmus]
MSEISESTISENTSQSQSDADDILVCENLTKHYIMGDQTVHALKGVSFKIKRGEFVAVLGPSGSGKSTCMNLMGCLDTPSSGKMILDGGDVSKLNRDQLADIRSRKIGFVFQQFNLLARTSAVDNVILPLLYTQVPKQEHVPRAKKCLEKVKLGDRGDHHPSQLSGGQQQRVAIARALVNDPVIILADEPTGALDTRTSIEIMALFQELNKKGITIILVTHEPEIADAAKRQLYFRDGLLQQDTINPSPTDMIAEAKALAQEDAA